MLKEKYVDSDSERESPIHYAHRGTFVGTPIYSTPEMLNKSTSGPFTDLWALGVILYQIVTGKIPWKTKDLLEIFNEIL